MTFKQHGLIKYGNSKPLREDTSIYIGSFGKMDPVAVKKIYCGTEAEIQRRHKEVDTWLKCVSHENIVQYFHQEEDDTFIYIALQLCHGNLDEWIGNEIDEIQGHQITTQEILRQTTEGVAHLHSMRIIHRNLKPKNILLLRVNADRICVKVADFEISKELAEGVTSVTATSSGGTEGWKAPEVLKASKGVHDKDIREAPSTDIFSLSCILYYVITNGNHPFGGDAKTQDSNIRNNTALMDLAQFLSPRLLGNLKLLLDMIAENRSDRPLTDYILNHHILWSDKKLLQFVYDIGIVFEDYNSNFVRKIKKELQTQFFFITENSFPLRDGWLSSTRRGPRSTLCPVIRNYLKNYRNPSGKLAYNGTCIVLLYRAIYNLSKHEFHGTMPMTVKAALGPENHILYWLARFPFLVSTLWIVCSGLRGTDCWHRINQYYP